MKIVPTLYPVQCTVYIITWNLPIFQNYPAKCNISDNSFSILQIRPKTDSTFTRYHIVQLAVLSSTSIHKNRPQTSQKLLKQGIGWENLSNIKVKSQVVNEYWVWCELYWMCIVLPLTRSHLIQLFKTILLLF